MIESAAPTLGAMFVPALLPGLRRGRDRLRDLRWVRQLGGLETAGLAVPNLPLYDGTRVVDLFFAVVIGVVTASRSRP